MGKGNRHRGGHDRKKQQDRGQDKEFAQRTFGAKGQRFNGTIGNALGQAQRHSEPCFTAIKAVRAARTKMEGLEKDLAKNVPEFKPWLAARNEMITLERKLNKLPSFVDYQKSRKGLRATVQTLTQEKIKCDKCSFAAKMTAPEKTTAQAETQTEPAPQPVPAAQPVPTAQPVPEPVQEAIQVQPVPSTHTSYSPDRSIGVPGQGGA